MAKRGKILRDANLGPGLLIVEGQQHSFTLEGVWKSAVPARPGLVVDVELDAAGNVSSITAIPDSQLAKEQAEVALAAAKEKGGQIFGQVVAKVGMPNLVAGLVLLISWFWLTAVSVAIPFGGKFEFSFWQILGFLSANNILDVMERNGHPSTGIYGLIAVVCMAGPFVQYFWKDKRAALGGLLPLVFMIIVGVMVRSSIHSAMGPVADGPFGDMQRQAQDEMMKAVSMGMGVYLSVLASLYFAGMGLKNFLAAKATEAPATIHKAAA